MTPTLRRIAYDRKRPFMLLFHYTSRVNAQLISIDQWLLPGSSWWVGFSPTLYPQAWLALDPLGLTHELEYVIDAAFYLDHPTPPAARHVDPVRDLGGDILRSGGGTEVRFSGPVMVD